MIRATVLAAVLALASLGGGCIVVSPVVKTGTAVGVAAGKVAGATAGAAVGATVRTIAGSGSGAEDEESTERASGK